ncbi:MAG: hypothetical protein WA160_08450 [Pseudobdellovibrio sp.]
MNLNKIVGLSLLALILGACGGRVKYEKKDSLEVGLRVNLGSDQDLVKGTKLVALKRDCSPNGKTRGCRFTTQGFLTVKEVVGKNSSIVTMDEQMELTEETFFERVNK